MSTGQLPVSSLLAENWGAQNGQKDVRVKLLYFRFSYSSLTNSVFIVNVYFLQTKEKKLFDKQS